MFRRVWLLAASSLLISALAQAEITGLYTSPGGSNGDVQINEDGGFGGRTLVGSGGATVSTTSTQIIITAGGGSSGGASTLAIKQNGVTVSSPTSAVNFVSPMLATFLAGTTSQITIDTTTASGVLINSSATATYLTISSSTANFLTLSSVTANYVSISSISANYLKLSSATATYVNKLSPYVSSANVTAALTVTANGTAGSTPQFGVNSASVAVLSNGLFPNFEIDGSSITKQGLLVAGNNITLTPGAGTLIIASTAGGGGSSNLAVGTGTASNFTNNVSSPTAALSFVGSQFRSTVSGATNFISIDPSVLASTTSLLAGDTNYIQNRTNFQGAGTTFFVASGTVRGQFNVQSAPTGNSTGYLRIEPQTNSFGDPTTISAWGTSIASGLTLRAIDAPNLLNLYSTLNLSPTGGLSFTTYQDVNPDVLWNEGYHLFNSTGNTSINNPNTTGAGVVTILKSGLSSANPNVLVVGQDNGASTIVPYFKVDSSTVTSLNPAVFSSSVTLSKALILGGSPGTANQVPVSQGPGLAPVWATQSGSGGGSGSLEVFNNFDGTRSSPTASIGASNAFRGTVIGSTYTFGINFSSVVSQSDLTAYMTQSSSTLNDLKLSSASATYFNKLSPYVSSINVTAALTITGNGTAGSTPQIGVNSSSVAVLSSGLVPNSEIDGSSITKQGVLLAGSNITLTPGAGSLTIASTGGGGITPGASYYVQVTNSLQTGATFYVSSGTIDTALIINGNQGVSGMSIVDHGITINNGFYSAAGSSSAFIVNGAVSPMFKADPIANLVSVSSTQFSVGGTTFTFPSGGGSSGQAIVTNGANPPVLTYATISGGSGGYAVQPATVAFQLNQGVSASTGVFAGLTTSTLTVLSSATILSPLRVVGAISATGALSGSQLSVTNSVSGSQLIATGSSNGAAMVQVLDSAATSAIAPIYSGLDLKYIPSNDSFLTHSEGYFSLKSSSNSITKSWLALGAGAIGSGNTTDYFVVDISTTGTGQGNVGIRTLSPRNDLEVNGSIGISSNVATGTISYSTTVVGLSISTNTQILGALTVISLGVNVSTINYGLVVGGHIEVSSTTPQLSSCGTSPSIVGNDQFGKITVGSVAAASCTMTFAVPWPNAPACTVMSNTAVVSPTGSTTTTAFTFGGTSIVNDVIMYMCGGYR